MALAQHHVSHRSNQHFLKKAATVLMITSIWAAVAVTAEGIDWSIFLTSVIISSSGEARITSRGLAHAPIVASKSQLNEQNVIKDKSEEIHTLRKNAPNTLLIRQKTLLMTNASSADKGNLWNNSGKKSKAFSKSSLAGNDNKQATNALDSQRNTLFNPYTENQPSMHRRSIEPEKCPQILGYMTCPCNETEVHCDELHISILAFLEPLSYGIKHVSAARNHLRVIPGISGAPNLFELSLAQNEIEVAHLKDLVHFTMLEKLDLSSNKLKELNLSEGEFIYLRQLNVSSNKLTIFQSQPLRITHLYLQRNMLSDVIFLSNFRSLEYLNLSFNRISYIPANIFENITDLYSLDLQNNEIMNADFVPQLTKVLHTLVLSNNRISSIPVKSFRSSKIVCLYLDNNTLTDANFLIYSNAAEINLNDNQFSNVNGKLFENKNKLKVLNMSGMNMTSMNFITSIPSLISLGIEGNNISCLPKGFLKNYRTLKEWFLLDNPLEDLLCPVSSHWTIDEMCNINPSNSEVQIRMKDENINDVIRCVLDNRHVFEDCEQKCNSASHSLIPPLLIFVVFNII